jgi:hypothetical protein
MNAAANQIKATLQIDPDTQWRLRREMMGLLKTLPVDMASQEALKAERDLIVARTYESL